MRFTFQLAAILLLLSAQAVLGQETRSTDRVVGAGYFQDQDKPFDLQVEFDQLDLRLRELEDDVENRLRAQDQEEESSEKSSTKLEERLAKLEKSVEAQEKATEELDGILPSLVYHGHKQPKITFFGRIHLDYWAFPEADETLFPLEGGNPQDRVVFRRIRIGAKGDLHDNMFYKYEGEFAGGVASSYRDVYLGFDNLPHLNTLIIGNQKRPYGLDHINSSNHNVFIERPFVVEAFNQDARRLGIASYGVSKDEKYNWRYGVWHEELTQDLFGWIGDHYQLEGAARLATTPWYDESSGGRGYAHFAISGSVGYPDGLNEARNAAQYRTRPEARSTRRWLDTGTIAGADTNMLIGLESVINIGSFQFVAEYLRTNVDRLDAFGPDLEFDGGYFYVAYFLTGEHMPWNRETGALGRPIPHENFFSVRDCDCQTQRGLGAWQIAARYSWCDLTDENIIGGEGDSLTIGLNWLWNPNARMQFNWIIGDIDRFPEGGGDYQILGARFMVDF
jgi:phosphate-selective porin OprO/OprP